jgi:hypothetical protein
MTRVPELTVVAAEVAAAKSVVAGMMTDVSVVMGGWRGPLMGEIIGPAITAVSAGVVHADLPGPAENLKAGPGDLAGTPGHGAVAGFDGGGRGG